MVCWNGGLDGLLDIREDLGMESPSDRFFFGLIDVDECCYALGGLEYA